LSALWLAYPLGPPAQPRVIGSVQAPPKTTDFNGPIAVAWTNSSGTEVIGSWNPQTAVPGGMAVTNEFAFIGRGEVRPFPWSPGLDGAVW
jgi:hypothetical protein